MINLASQIASASAVIGTQLTLFSLVIILSQLKEKEGQQESINRFLRGVIDLKACDCAAENHSFICLSVRVSRNRSILHYFVPKDIKIHTF